MYKSKILSIIILLFALNITLADSLPSVTLIDSQGKAVSSEALATEGTNTLLLFFNICCYPSLAAIEDLNYIENETLDSLNLEIVLVSVDDTRYKNKVLPKLKSLGNKYKFYYDTNSDFKRSMGVIDCPHYIVLDTNISKIYDRSGYLEDIEDLFFLKIYLKNND